MDRPPAILTSPEPDRALLSRVKRNEPDIVAHVWATHPDQHFADGTAAAVRKSVSLAGCPSCARNGAVLVDVVPVQVNPLGATAQLFAVVLRHAR